MALAVKLIAGFEALDSCVAAWIAGSQDAEDKVYGRHNPMPLVAESAGRDIERSLSPRPDPSHE
jgi:hypothetical protein